MSPDPEPRVGKRRRCLSDDYIKQSKCFVDTKFMERQSESHMKAIAAKTIKYLFAGEQSQSVHKFDIPKCIVLAGNGTLQLSPELETELIKRSILTEKPTHVCSNCCISKRLRLDCSNCSFSLCEYCGFNCVHCASPICRRCLSQDCSGGDYPICQFCYGCCN